MGQLRVVTKRSRYCIMDLLMEHCNNDINLT